MSIDEIQQRLRRATAQPYEAAAIGVEIFSLTNDCSEHESRELVSTFLESLNRWGLDGVLLNQANYALRLAEDPGELMYEEMHKLFSLLDEIHSLQQIGLVAPKPLIDELKVAVRRRFEIQQAIAAMVSNDRVEDWSRDLWWYANNVDK